MVGAVTTTPHDALFKAAFSKLRHARGLLRALIPSAIGRRIAWPTLRLESGIVVNQFWRVRQVSVSSRVLNLKSCSARYLGSARWLLPTPVGPSSSTAS